MVSIEHCDYADPKHARAAISLLNAYIKDEMGGGKELDEEAGRLLIKRLGSQKNAIVLFAKNENEFAGLLSAFENTATFSAKPMINIHDIIVLKQYRGKGIGRKLMDALVEEAKKRACSRITLEVREDNKIAQNLYKSMDFKETKPKMIYLRREL
jgi:ribosomal protein S18 acetylase RimI-like enzyme